MPSKGRRRGYVYVTAAIRQEDFKLLESFARTEGTPITQAIGELVHQARPMLAMNASANPEQDPEGATQTLLDILESARQEVLRVRREYRNSKEAS